MFTGTEVTSIGANHPKGMSGAHSPIPPLPPTLKEAIVRVIKGGGRMDHLAERAGLNPRDVYRWAESDGNRSREYRPLPASVVPQLCVAADRYDILSWMCAKARGTFVPDPPTHEGACRQLLPQMIKENAEAQIAFAESLGTDGVITEREADRFEAEGRQAIAIIHQAIVAARMAAQRRPLAKKAAR